MHIAIVGASRDRAKFGNKAVRAYQEHGDTVYPINPHEREIEGLACYKSVLDVPHALDAVSLYVPSAVSLGLVSAFAQKGVRVAYVNPGAESDELVHALEHAGIEARLACSIRAIGKTPGRYA